MSAPPPQQKNNSCMPSMPMFQFCCARIAGVRSNFVTCCIPLSCKYRSDGGRNTPYGVPVVEASISSKSSGPL